MKKNVHLRMEACQGRSCWMNREILVASRRKKRLWRQVRVGGLTEEYREADKKVKTLIRNAKRHIEKKLANKEGGSNRPFFANIKRKTKSRPCIGPLKDREKKVVTEDEDGEDPKRVFPLCFYERGCEQYSSCRADENREAGECPDHGMAAQEEDPEAQPASAAGPDGIGPRLLQELESELVEGLVLIFQWSIDTGVVPEDWKSANVTPIFTKGAKSDPGNYWPVCLTSICCKLLESILQDVLMAHLERNKLINQSQHGFMPKNPMGQTCLNFWKMSRERWTRADLSP